MDQDQDRFGRLISSPLFRFFDRIVYIVCMNFIMILFSLCGLLLFGYYPSVFSAAQFNNAALEEREGKLVSEFWKGYKKWFLRGNIMMVITLATVVSGYFLLFHLTHNISMGLEVIIFFLYFLVGIMVVILNLFLPSISVLYPEFSTKKAMLFSLVAACKKPLVFLELLAISIAWVYASILMPQLALFVLLSLVPWFSHWILKRVLQPDTMPDH